MATESIRPVFDERIREVSRWIAFLRAATDKNGAHFDAMGLDEPRVLVKTALATTYLLLYNVVEYTVFSALQTIQDVINRDGIHFDQLNCALRRRVLNQFAAHLERRRGDRDKVALEIVPLAKNIVSAGYRPDALLSGNIDDETFEDLKRSYELQLNGVIVKDRRERFFARVKDVRNQLAHGNVSFLDVGEGTSVDELAVALENIEKRLAAFLDCVDDYLKRRHFELSAQQAAAPLT